MPRPRVRCPGSRSFIANLTRSGVQGLDERLDGPGPDDVLGRLILGDVVLAGERVALGLAALHGWFLLEGAAGQPGKDEFPRPLRASLALDHLDDLGEDRVDLLLRKLGLFGEVGDEL